MSTPSCDQFYALGDGDNIRLMVERELLAGNVEGCGAVSRAIIDGMSFLDEYFRRKEGWRVIYCGGDDILVEVAAERYDPATVREAISGFKKRAGSSISFGTGSTILSAYLNLRRAKSLHSGLLVCETELTRAPARALAGQPPLARAAGQQAPGCA